MAVYNEKWRRPSWPRPEPDAGDYVLEYAKKIDHLPEVRGVWAVVIGGMLHIYTLIEPSRDTERQIHEVELVLLNTWQEPAAQFHIYRDPEALQEQVGGIEPVLVRR